MKHLNEIGRIKELMSLINEGEGLKFLERLLQRGETNSIKKAEGAIDDVFKVLDDETISKLESFKLAFTDFLWFSSLIESRHIIEKLLQIDIITFV